MSERPNKLVDGELVPLTDDEWQDYQDREQKHQANIVARRVIAAPAAGFGGPTGKDIFNGNR